MEMIQLTSSLKLFKSGSRDQKHKIRGICSVRGCRGEHVARNHGQSLRVAGARPVTRKERFMRVPFVCNRATREAGAGGL